MPCSWKKFPRSCGATLSCQNPSWPLAGQRGSSLRREKRKVVVKLQAAERADEVFSAALSQLVSCVKEGIVSVSRCAEDSDCVVKRGNARESKGRGGCIHPSKLVGQPGNRLAFAVRMTRRTGSHQGRATQGKAHIERRRITGNAVGPDA